MADIIAFPSNKFAIPVNCTQTAPVIQATTLGSAGKSARKRKPNSSDDVVARAILLCATAEPAPLAALPDSAWVIGTALRWINRRGKSRKAVPKLVLGLLDRHVTAGDPAAEMFDRWLDGRALPGSTAYDVELRAGLTSEGDAAGRAEGGE